MNIELALKGISAKKYLVLAILLASMFSFWKLGSGDVSEWDEAEYGTIAFEMMHNGDYINYYYAGELDTRNGKPPLMIWSILVCYKIFGFNSWSLRLTSAIASILFFLFAFRIVALYRSKIFAFSSFMVLLSCKAIIGFHVGRTGDTDALLIFFLAAALYYFLQFIDFEKRNGIYLFAIFIGLAFYTKGTAAFVLIPGLLIYSFIRKNWKTLLRNKDIWFSTLILLTIIASWIVLLSLYGKDYDHEVSWYGSHNAIETLFKHDTFARLSDENFEPVKKNDWMFIFSALDIRFNLWNYLFYISIIIISIIQFKSKKVNPKGNEKDKLIPLSFSLIIPYALILSIAATKHEWYIVPLALPISIIIIEGLRISYNQKKILAVLWIAVFSINIIRQFIYVNSPKTDVADFFANNKSLLKDASAIQIIDYPTQDIMTYINWHSNKVIYPKQNLKPNNSGGLIFYDSEKSNSFAIDSMRSRICIKQFCFTPL